MRAEDLIGAWTLASWRIDYRDGRRTHPFGEDARGLMIYGAGGAMSAAIARAGRPGFAAPRPKDWTEGERAAAFDGYFHYAGRWSLTDGKVTHRVELSLNPAMEATVQVREARLEGELLTLSAEEALGGGRARHHRLVWRRRGGGAQESE